MFNQLKVNEAALLLHALRAVYVSNEEETRQKLIKALEQALSRRGMALKEEA